MPVTAKAGHEDPKFLVELRNENHLWFANPEKKRDMLKELLKGINTQWEWVKLSPPNTIRAKQQATLAVLRDGILIGYFNDIDLDYILSNIENCDPEYVNQIKSLKYDKRIRKRNQEYEKWLDELEKSSRPNPKNFIYSVIVFEAFNSGIFKDLCHFKSRFDEKYSKHDEYPGEDMRLEVKRDFQFLNMYCSTDPIGSMLEAFIVPVDWDIYHNEYQSSTLPYMLKVKLLQYFRLYYDRRVIDHLSKVDKAIVELHKSQNSTDNLQKQMRILLAALGLNEYKKMVTKTPYFYSDPFTILENLKITHEKYPDHLNYHFKYGKYVFFYQDRAKGLGIMLSAMSKTDTWESERIQNSYSLKLMLGLLKNVFSDIEDENMERKLQQLQREGNYESSLEFIKSINNPKTIKKILKDGYVLKNNKKY